MRGSSEGWQGQFGGVAGTVRRDGKNSSKGWQGLVLRRLSLKCSTSGRTTNVTGNFVRVLFLDYMKAFDLINHDILINKQVTMELPAHLVRWMAVFLLDHEQGVKIGDVVSEQGNLNGGVSRGTLYGPKQVVYYYGFCFP